MNSRKQNGGYIEARDLKTNEVLWGIQVYETQTDPKLETDVQDVFITALSIDGDTLKVSNERGEIYLVALATRKAIKAENTADRPVSIGVKRWWEFWK